MGKRAFRAMPTAAVAGVKVGARSLSSGARSRDPLALRTLRTKPDFLSATPARRRHFDPVETPDKTPG
jgi:hypothetical protein